MRWHVLYGEMSTETLRCIQVMDVLRDDSGVAMDPDKASERLNAAYASLTSLPNHSFSASGSATHPAPAFPNSTRSVIG